MRRRGPPLRQVLANDDPRAPSGGDVRRGTPFRVPGLQSRQRRESRWRGRQPIRPDGLDGDRACRQPDARDHRRQRSVAALRTRLREHALLHAEPDHVRQRERAQARVEVQHGNPARLRGDAGGGERDDVRLDPDQSHRRARCAHGAEEVGVRAGARHHRALLRSRQSRRRVLRRQGLHGNARREARGRRREHRPARLGGDGRERRPLRHRRRSDGRGRQGHHRRLRR